VRVVKALIRAAKWLDENDNANREEAVEILARPEYVGADAKVIANSMTGTFEYEGEATLPPSGSIPSEITVPFFGEGEFDPFTDSGRSRRNDAVEVDGVFEEVNEFTDLEGYNATLGLQYTLLLAVLTGVSVLIPYIGAAVVTLPVALVALFQWGPTAEFYYVLVAYLVIQALDGNLLAPLLFSEVVNLHPVAIIVAILFFGGIWGFWGVFFAIPLATLINAVLRAWPGVGHENEGGEAAAA